MVSVVPEGIERTSVALGHRFGVKQEALEIVVHCPFHVSVGEAELEHTAGSSRAEAEAQHT